MQNRLQTIRLVPSLLDRLFDDDPSGLTEAQPTFRQGLEAMKRAVARDLENLLNTRADVISDFDTYPELPRSVANYGLPDFSSLSAASELDRNRIRTAIQQAISRFETRLIEVRVHLAQDASQRHAFSYHIEALLRIDPVPEPVVFDALLDVATQLYRVD